jgi:hypothetical protein
MYKISTSELQELIRDMNPTKTPLMVYGGPGIGKTEIKGQMARALAEEEKKKFVIWTEASREEKIHMIENADEYFVFADQRVAQMDPTDLRGIPNMVSGTEWLETIPMSWIVYFTQPKAHGIIFFDEINLAPPLVAAQAYQIINERTVADRALSPHVHLLAAGNRLTDKAFVFDMPLPLRDRFAEVEIYPDAQSWTNWAYGKVNPHLIAFIQWKESFLYKINDKSDDKSSTPRGIVRASRLIGDKDITSNKVHQLVSISVGNGFATEFQAYTRHFAELNWAKIYADPTSIAKFEVDKLWAISGGLAENYTREKEQKMFDKTIKVIMSMPQDFAISTLRMIKDTDLKTFSKLIQKCPDFQKLTKAFGKYIID